MNPKAIFQTVTYASMLLVVSSLPSCTEAPTPVSLKSHVDGGNQANAEPEAAGDGDGDAEPVSEGQQTGEAPDVVVASAPAPAPAPSPVVLVPKFVPCIEQSETCHPHQMIMADYAAGKIIYVNLDDPSKDWDLVVPGGARDIQLIGSNKVLVGTVEGGAGPFGYHEVDIATGKIQKSVLGLTGPVMSVQRLVNGNTLLIGANLLGLSGAVVVEVNEKKEIVSKRAFPGMANFRTVRRSRDGHFLLGNHATMMELTVEGQEVWKADMGAEPSYMALKLGTGERVAASGHGGQIFFFDKAGTKTGGFTLPNIDSSAAKMHSFASSFALLPNGNIVTTNWSGGADYQHGNDGPQVAEYTRDGKVVWTWKQQANRINSIYAVLVLDNLDLSKAHDDTNGPLEPLTLAYP